MINNTNIFLGLFGGAVAIALTTVVLWHILHVLLCKKYDELLFKQPYFRVTELAVYSSWPLSLFRSMSYILLLGAPSLAKIKRFKGVTLDHSNDFFLVVTCRIFLSLVGLGVIFVLIMMIWSIWW